jgi:hypothetical protein
MTRNGPLYRLMTQSGLSSSAQARAIATFASKCDDLARYACNTLSEGPYAYYQQKVQSNGGI